MRKLWWLPIVSALALGACTEAEDTDQPAQKFAALSLFEPAASSPLIPFPIDLLFLGFNDPTLNIPNSSNNPAVTAANLTDGWSTTASIFADLTGQVDLSTAADGVWIIDTGAGVRAPRRLEPGVDYRVQFSFARDTDGVPISLKRSRLLVEPLKPLQPSTTYLVALTKAITSKDGLPILPSPYFTVTASNTPVSEQSNPILNGLTATQLGTLEALRSQLIRPTVQNLDALTSLAESDLILAWPFTTQSTNKTLQRLNDSATAQNIVVFPSGQRSEQLGAPAGADVWLGNLDVPYYLRTPSTSTATQTIVSGFWNADVSKPDTSASFLGKVSCQAFAGGATLPDGQTAQPSASTTLCYPLPVAQSTETLPVLMTVPNGAGITKPANGWPVVIFQHGITGDRSQMLAIGPSLAAAGIVTIAIDLPLHGIVPTSSAAGLRMDGSNIPAPFQTNERTFDVNLVNNSTGAPPADSAVDASGTHFINLPSLITSRDNLRQGVADLIHLTKSLGNIDMDNNPGTTDIDTSRIGFIGHSLGGIVGTTLAGVNSDISTVTLAMPGGGIAKLLDASKAFGPRISGGLASLGVTEGSDAYESFMRFAQHLTDPGDPVNFASAAATKHPIHLIEVIGDTVVPNEALSTDCSPLDPCPASRPADKDRVTVSGFLSGTSPLIELLGLTDVGAIDVPVGTADVRTSGTGLDIAVRFNQGDHGSILSPAASAAATQEMQRQTVNFHASRGACLPIGGNCPQ